MTKLEKAKHVVDIITSCFVILGVAAGVVGLWLTYNTLEDTRKPNRLSLLVNFSVI